MVGDQIDRIKDWVYTGNIADLGKTLINDHDRGHVYDHRLL